MVKKIFHYFVQFVKRPIKASEEIADDKWGVWAGLWWVFIFCFAYSIVAFVYYLLNHLPTAEPFLNIIPLKKWYLIQTFTTIPIGLAGLLGYSGIAYLFSKALGGKGSFDATFASQSFTLHIPCFILMWIPEALLFPFLFMKGIHSVPWPNWVENLRIFIIPLPWIMIISVIALSKVHKISWWKSVFVFIISLIPFAMIMAAFIR